MLNATKPVTEVVVRRWQEVMATSRKEWEAETAAVMTQWSARFGSRVRLRKRACR